MGNDKHKFTFFVMSDDPLDVFEKIEGLNEKLEYGCPYYKYIDTSCYPLLRSYYQNKEDKPEPKSSQQPAMGGKEMM